MDEHRLRLLGAFQLSIAGKQVDLAPLSERLLAYLALHPRSCRERVAGVLWSDRGSRRATAGLRTALWRLPRLRQAGIVAVDGDRLALAPDVVVDFVSASLAADDILEGGTLPERLDGLDDDLLPGWYDDWLTGAQERWRQTRLHALEMASARLLAAGEIVHAVETALRAVESEPLRESAHRCVIAAHVAEGNGAEAVRQLRRYLDELSRNGLNALASPAMTALLDGIVPDGDGRQPVAASR
jgi:DNA-binding SARP family transcriptional activator